MKTSINRVGDELRISFRGDINDSCESELKDLLQKIEAPKVCLNLEHIELINSLGARIWLNFVRAVKPLTQDLTYQNCSVAFIECCNIYSKFAKPEAIVSLYVPAECTKCGRNANILCQSKQLLSDNAITPSTCSTCHSLMEPQVALEEYLQCLSEG